MGDVIRQSAGPHLDYFSGIDRRRQTVQGGTVHRVAAQQRQHVVSDTGQPRARGVDIDRHIRPGQLRGGKYQVIVEGNQQRPTPASNEATYRRLALQVAVVPDHGRDPAEKAGQDLQTRLAEIGIADEENADIPVHGFPSPCERRINRSGSGPRMPDGAKPCRTRCAGRPVPDRNFP